MYPTQRPRRLRNNAIVRSLVRETSVEFSHLIYPMFINAELKQESAIQAMPGIFEHTIDSAMREIERLYESGLRHLLLFGVPNHKDDRASGAYEEKGIVQTSIKRIKSSFT